MVSSSDRLWFGGFASGLDTTAIIDALTAAERRPIVRQEQRRAGLQVEQQAFQALNSRLSSFLSQLDGLRNADTVGGRSVSQLHKTEDLGKLSVSAAANAPLTSFQLDILGLATRTTVDSGSALGQAIDADAALAQAGFGTPLEFGTFTINGTQFAIVDDAGTAVTSEAAIGAAVGTAVALQDAGLSTAPAPTGTFSINGVAINYDATTDSLDTILANINASAAGVTATYDAATRTVELQNDAAGPAAITLSDDSGNFLEAVGVLNAAQTAGTNATTLNDVIDDINNAGIGVTASLVNDAYGRPNLLQLTSAGNVLLGSGADTSNFLAATSLLDAPAGTTRTSQRPLAVIDLAAALDEAGLDTALSQAQGEFTVNGVSFTYDAAVDSLSDLMTRINESEAGVTVSYDPYADALRFTAEETGAQAVGLVDVTGNFLEAIGVVGGGEDVSYGALASYQIDGGPVRYSASNTVTSAVSGVTLNFKGTTTDSIDVSVTPDNAGLAKRLSDFANAYNDLAIEIGGLTRFDEDGNNDGPLMGDSIVSRLARNVRTMITGTATGMTGAVTSLAAIGLTFGDVGAKVGTTDTLLFDQAKFNQAVATNPDGVRNLLAGFSASATLTTSGNSVASISGAPANVGDSGAYTFDMQAGGALTVTFTPDNGDSPIVTSHTVAAGEVNTTIIPGLTITFDDPLTIGVDTIQVGAQQEGVAKSLYEYVNTFTRTGGILQGRNEELQTRVDDVNVQIERMEVRVEARRQRLIQRYAQLEVVMSQLQSQQQALTSLMGSIQANAPQRRS